MVRFAMLALVATITSSVTNAMKFLNPPTYSNLKGDFSKAVTLKQGSVINVMWSPAEPGQGISLVLWQLDNKTGVYFGDMEYLTQGAVGVNKYEWLVGSRKDLTKSNLFYLSIFQEGKAGSADDNSEYLYLTAKEATQQVVSSIVTSVTTSPITSTSLKSSVPPSATASSPSNTTPLGPSSPAAPTSAPTQAPTTPEAFSMASKIGLGVSIPVALALGLGIGFLLFRRRKKNEPIHEVHGGDIASPIGYKGDKHLQNGYYVSNVYEAPQKSPVELARGTGGSNYQRAYQQYAHGAPVTYEM